eukprot:TRINITY_DN514_c0_g1_i1.p1 TRINITY_DN514_c0_g1~~TRINITY_DN514_c0_g1_i1.p1  ORF type:complete len:592 (+),score=275.51 TRINITY_DN514_c0_g1_i1:26-1801(+)
MSESNQNNGSENNQRKRKWDIPDEPSAADIALQTAQVIAQVNQALAAKGLIPAKTEDLIREISINDSPARILLTKGMLHQEIKQETGAAIVTRGRYVPPGEQPPPGEKPLYLYISSTNRESLEKAVRKVEEIIANNGVVTNTTTTTVNGINTIIPPMKQIITKIGKIFIQKCYIGIEIAEAKILNFNLIGKLLGPKGQFVKHINAQTTAKLILRGKGSTFVDPNGTADDQFEPLHFSISALSENSVNSARVLAESLIDHVRKDFDNHKGKGMGNLSLPNPTNLLTSPFPKLPTQSPYQYFGTPSNPFGSSNYPPTPTTPFYSPYAAPPYATMTIPPVDTNMPNPPYPPQPLQPPQPGQQLPNPAQPYDQYYGYNPYYYAPFTDQTNMENLNDQNSASPLSVPLPPVTETSPNSDQNRKFQEYPSKKLKNQYEGGLVGPQIPTQEEYESSMKSMQELSNLNEQKFNKQSQVIKKNSPTHQQTVHSKNNNNSNNSNNNNNSSTISSNVKLVDYDGEDNESTTNATKTKSKSQSQTPFWAVPSNYTDDGPLLGNSSSSSTTQKTNKNNINSILTTQAKAEQEAKYKMIMRDLGL